MRKNGLASGFRYYGPDMCGMMVADLGLDADEAAVRSMQKAFIKIGKDPTVGEIYLAGGIYSLCRMTGMCTVSEITSRSESLLALWQDFTDGAGFTEPPTLCEAAYAAVHCPDDSKSRIFRTVFPVVTESAPAALFSAGGYTLADYREGFSDDRTRLQGSCRTFFRPASMPPSEFLTRMNSLTALLDSNGIRFAVRPLSPRGFLGDISGCFQGASVNLKGLDGICFPEDAARVLGSGALFAVPFEAEPYFDMICRDSYPAPSGIIRTLSSQPIYGINADGDSLMTDYSTVSVLYRGQELSLGAEISGYAVCDELPVESGFKSDISAFAVSGDIYETLEKLVSGKKWAIGGRLSPYDSSAVPAIVSLNEFVGNTGNAPVCADFTPGRKTSFTVFTA